MAIIQLNKIKIQFGPQVVLDNVSLSLEKGQTLVIIGPSGQGKTSLLKVMAGLLTPQSGEFLFEGRPWLTLSDSERAKALLRMGMLFQKNALFDSLTCGENIAFPLRETTALSPQEISDKVDFFLEAVGISHAKNLYPDEISGGMQKRLGIARALALRPEVIFYDDPTAGLDPITSKKIIELILSLKKEYGSTVVAITNDMNRAYQMADQIVMVVDGQTITAGTPAQTQAHVDPRVHQFVRGELTGPLSVIE